jgi:cell division GTPase FtsZ
MLHLVGVGGAGSRIVDSFYQKNVVKKIIDRIQARNQWEFSGIAIDTSENLKSLSNIPAKNTVLIGKSRVKGHGTGVHVSLGKKIVKEELGLAMNTLSRTVKEKPWLVILIVGLGGGTGTGGLPVVAKKIKDVYKCKTLGLFILPSSGEGKVYVKNAFKNFESVLSSVDCAIILDNNVVTDKGEDILSAQKLVNQQILGFFKMVNEAFIDNNLTDLSTIAYYKSSSEHLSIKDAIEKMLRENLFLKFDISKADRIFFVARGNLEHLYGHDFAQGWAKDKFQTDLKFEFYDEVGARGLEVGLLIVGTKDLNGRFNEIREVESKKQSTELDNLLKDINSIF